jgi:hypothetical protein
LVAVTFSYAAAAASPANVLAAYTAKFGAPVTGNRLFVSLQTYQDYVFSVLSVSADDS